MSPAADTPAAARSAASPGRRGFAPFCSRRCADIDLGRWLKGGYAIPGRPEDDVDKAPEARRTRAKPRRIKDFAPAQEGSGRPPLDRAGNRPLRSPTFRLSARAQVAQSVEQRIENPRVGSSILSLGTTRFPLIIFNGSTRRTRAHPRALVPEKRHGDKIREPEPLARAPRLYANSMTPAYLSVSFCTSYIEAEPI